jgi:hypothetical protein
VFGNFSARSRTHYYNLPPWALKRASHSCHRRWIPFRSAYLSRCWNHCNIAGLAFSSGFKLITSLDYISPATGWIPLRARREAFSWRTSNVLDVQEGSTIALCVNGSTRILESQHQPQVQRSWNTARCWFLNGLCRCNGHLTVSNSSCRL